MQYAQLQLVMQPWRFSQYADYHIALLIIKKQTWSYLGQQQSVLYWQQHADTGSDT